MICMSLIYTFLSEYQLQITSILTTCKLRYNDILFADTIIVQPLDIAISAYAVKLMEMKNRA